MKSQRPEPGELLNAITYPDDLRNLDMEQLPEVCDDLRDFIIDTISHNGGHFGASLGVVELTVAMHYVYNTPHDLLVWDVGHQAYGHKILTGRREAFDSNRRYQGLSGFPKRSESPYDTFGVGHSSTSISAGLGMTVGQQMLNKDKKVVALIGDGAMTAGLAFEAMNNAGVLNRDILVILNDNAMSIDPNVGALKEYLADITTTETFNRMRDEIYDLLGHFKSAGEKMRKAASKLEDAVTSAMTPGGLFKALGFKYYGPVDGHNVKALARQMRDLRNIDGPKLLHAVTIKGKGFPPAEQDQVKWHAQGSPFDKVTGQSLAKKPKVTPAPKYQDVFADTLIDLAKQDEKIVGITAAMPSGTSMLKMMEQIPDRAYDVGIAEQHAVTFSAGLATQGIKPFVAIYSTFLQRAYDQVVHDVAIQKLPVVFCMDRAGLAGADGPTHHGLYDISYLRSLPHFTIGAPMNEIELQHMIYTAWKHQDGPFAIRYPRGASVGLDRNVAYEYLEPGKGRTLQVGEDIAILSYGTIGNEAAKAVEQLDELGIHVGHYDLRYVKPLDTELIDRVASEYRHLITVEDGAKLGGFGATVAEYLMQTDHRPGMTILGVPDRIVEHGTQPELYHEVGIDAEGIVENTKKLASELIPR